MSSAWRYAFTLELLRPAWPRLLHKEAILDQTVSGSVLRLAATPRRAIVEGSVARGRTGRLLYPSWEEWMRSSSPTASAAAAEAGSTRTYSSSPPMSRPRAQRLWVGDSPAAAACRYCVRTSPSRARRAGCAASWTKLTRGPGVGEPRDARGHQKNKREYGSGSCQDGRLERANSVAKQLVEGNLMFDDRRARASSVHIGRGRVVALASGPNRKPSPRNVLTGS